MIIRQGSWQQTKLDGGQSGEVGRKTVASSYSGRLFSQSVSQSVTQSVQVFADNRKKGRADILKDQSAVHKS